MITLDQMKVFNSVQDQVSEMIVNKFIEAEPHLKDIYQYCIIITEFDLEKNKVYFLNGSSGEWESDSIPFSALEIEE